jgi:hypothetical protein
MACAINRLFESAQGIWLALMDKAAVHGEDSIDLAMRARRAASTACNAYLTDA